MLFPGLFVYHCAAAPIPIHIANGMYGGILVQPKDQKYYLPEVDKEYYVVQSEYYYEPPERDENNQLSNLVEVSYPKGLEERPDLVVFNGKQNALTEKPLKANVGETVRLYFCNIGMINAILIY